MWVLIPLISMIYVFAIYEDFRHRAVSWPVFPVLFLLHLAAHYLQLKSIDWLFLTFNIAFLCFVFAFVWLYFRIKSGQNGIIDSYIGKGDILLLLSLAPLFAPANFILFNIVSWIFSLLFAPFMKRHIPLVSTVLIFASITFAITMFFDLNVFFDQTLILSYLWKISN